MAYGVFRYETLSDDVKRHDYIQQLKASSFSSFFSGSTSSGSANGFSGFNGASGPGAGLGFEDSIDLSEALGLFASVALRFSVK